MSYRKSMNYGPESVIVSNKGIEVRTPPYPEECSYVRIVDQHQDLELLYWSSDEWQEDPGSEAIGAIMGAIKAVVKGELQAHMEILEDRGFPTNTQTKNGR